MPNECRHRLRTAASMAAIALSCTCALAEPTTRAAADPLNSMPSYGQALARMLLVLGCIVVALIVAAKLLPRLAPRLLNKYARPDSKRLIEILDAQPLDRFQRLYVVRVDAQRFLIASGDKGATLLGELDAPSEPGRTFADVLNQTKRPEER